MGRLFVHLFGGIGLLALLAIGCGEVGDDGPQGHVDAASVVDDAGREIVLGEPPSRVISLVPSATGILLALGLEQSLVARTDFDPINRHPELADRPSVGGGMAPSVERILALDPELVIRFHGESDADTPRLLDAAGVPHLAIRPDGISDVRRIIVLLGRITATTMEAESILADLDRSLDAVRERVEGVDRPRVAFLLGGDPPLIAGGGTFLHELIELAGGENVFADLRLLYAPVSVEEVVRRRVELILTPEGARLPAGLSSVPVHRTPEAMQLPGLEMVASAEHIARILHPDLFP